MDARRLALALTVAIILPAAAQIADGGMAQWEDLWTRASRYEAPKTFCIYTTSRSCWRGYDDIAGWKIYEVYDGHNRTKLLDHAICQRRTCHFLSADKWLDMLTGNELRRPALE